MHLDAALALAHAHRTRLGVLANRCHEQEAAVATLADQLRALAHQKPSASVARKRSDLRIRKHAAEAELAAQREQVDTLHRELAHIEQAIATAQRAAQARAARQPAVARPVATPLPSLRTPPPRPVAEVAPIAQPVARAASSAQRPAVSPADRITVATPTATERLPGTDRIPTAEKKALPPPPRGAWRTAILPEQEGSYGAKIGPYRIESLLGSGNQASVFLATDAIRQVALKLIDAAEVDQEVWRALRREARRLAAIRSDNVIAAYGFDEVEFQNDDGHAPFRLAYLALEYLDQGTLIHLEQRAGGRMGIADAVDAAVQSAMGIAAIHSAGVLHRDIKPQNIMATARDGMTIYRVGDLGVAVEHDLPTEISGTLNYLAPEIVLASRDRSNPAPFSHASDIYGLGATLFRMVTGKTPLQALAAAFDGEGRVHAADLFTQRSAVPDARSLRADCPKPLAKVLADLLAFDPAKRPASAEDAAEAIQEAAATKRRLFGW